MWFVTSGVIAFHWKKVLGKTLVGYLQVFLYHRRRFRQKIDGSAFILTVLMIH